MAVKLYKYEAKNGDVTVCEMSFYDDGHWVFDKWPADMTKASIDSYTESFSRSMERISSFGLTSIEVKKL